MMSAITLFLLISTQCVTVMAFVSPIPSSNSHTTATTKQLPTSPVASSILFYSNDGTFDYSNGNLRFGTGRYNPGTQLNGEAGVNLSTNGHSLQYNEARRGRAGDYDNMYYDDYNGVTDVATSSPRHYEDMDVTIDPFDPEVRTYPYHGGGGGGDGAYDGSGSRRLRSGSPELYRGAVGGGGGRRRLIGRSRGRQGRNRGGLASSRDPYYYPEEPMDYYGGGGGGYDDFGYDDYGGRGGDDGGAVLGAFGSGSDRVLYRSGMDLGPMENEDDSGRRGESRPGSRAMGGRRDDSRPARRLSAGAAGLVDDEGRDRRRSGGGAVRAQRGRGGVGTARAGQQQPRGGRVPDGRDYDSREYGRRSEHFGTPLSHNGGGGGGGGGGGSTGRRKFDERGFYFEDEDGRKTYVYVDDQEW